MSADAAPAPPEAGPSRLPASDSAPSGPSADAAGFRDHGPPLSESAESSSAAPAGWQRFLTLLSELNSSQRLAFTAEVLALEHYLTTRVRYETAELSEQVAFSGADASFSGDTYKSNQPSIEQAMDDLMKSVELDKTIDASTTVRMEDTAAATSRVVHVNGLPFLLYIPRGFTGDKQNAKRFAVLRSRKRHEVQLNILRTMLVALRTLMPISSLPSLPNRHPANDLLHGPRARPGAVPIIPGANAVPIAPNAAHRGFSIVINLDEVWRMAVPLFFLSLKLAFLLWIFGKHASPRKRMILITMAVLWVIYEAWSIRHRRTTELRRQREREREEIARAARRRRGDVTPALDRGAPAFPLPNGEAGAEAQPERRRHHRPRHPTSPFTPKYWINVVASVGLAAEAREMGLARHATRPHQRVPAEPPPTTLQGKAKRVFRRFVIGFVLFVGTLIPEIEKRRKRLLEKRERLRSQLEADRLAQIAAAQGLRTANGPVASAAPASSTPSVVGPSSTPTVVAPIPRPVGSAAAPAQSLGEAAETAAPDPTPTLAATHRHAPLPPASPAPPAADDIGLLAPPTPDLATDDEDDRPDEALDEVGMILF